MVRRITRGASWDHPIIKFALYAIDPADYVVRRLKRHPDLPPYSVRARSIGIRGDLGGSGFVEGGRKIAGMLRKYASMTPDSKVLEIGCGCGRTAIALAEILQDGNYTGMDIERISLESAKTNSLLQRKRFSFELLDVHNDLYNPTGRYPATEYVFPYPASSFDVIFMTSVFTHMLTDEVKNYAKEIARVLKPGGRLYVTAFLLDRKMEKEFPFSSQDHSYADASCPEIAVGYHTAFLSKMFAEYGMTLTAGPLWGTIHGDIAETEDYQDLLIFTRKDLAG
jgi:ubiquinone/menaquinone biosynthesis C-methylase UbiE